MRATYTIQISGTAGAHIASAIFPPGIFASRPQIHGAPAATPQAAIAALLGMQKLHITLAAIASK